jgi:pimeloyl-ACP methyl ester carboxylesterase
MSNPPANVRLRRDCSDGALNDTTLIPETKTIAFDGLIWSYWVGGKGEPLLWLHGLSGEPSWGPHLARLAEQYRLYVPVLPGYQGSDFPSWMDTMEDAALLLVEFLDALSLDAVSVVGHSLGGWAAAEVAIFRPGRVKGLVLIDPFGLCLDWTRLPNIFYCDPAALPGIFFADPDGEPAARYFPSTAQWDERYIVNRGACARLAFEPYLHSRRLPVRLRFADSPTLIIWGAEDRLFSAEHANQWKALMPNAQTLVINDAGHFPHVEQPEACLPTILTFLQDTNAREDAR